jgi:hypothetical protein
MATAAPTRTLSTAARLSLWALEGASALILSLYATWRLYPWMAAQFNRSPDIQAGGFIAILVLVALVFPLLAVLLALLVHLAAALLPLRMRIVTDLLVFTVLLLAIVVPAVQVVTDILHPKQPLSAPH